MRYVSLLGLNFVLTDKPVRDLFKAHHQTYFW